jgi:hypothetical protein
MINEKPPPPAVPEKKRRFRFSLRTLLIVVLLYALCWTLTATWGVWGVGMRLIELNTHTNDIEWVSYRELQVKSREKKAGSEWQSATGKGSAVFPFVVKWTFQNKTADGVKSHESTATFVWIFGYKLWLDELPERPRKK